MRIKTRLWHSVLIASLSILTACATLLPEDDSDPEHGVHVDPPKVYDNNTLKQQLALLQGRISQLNGVDQNSLTSRLGSLQGATSSQTSFGLQALGLPVAGSTTTATNSTPSTVQTNGNTSQVLTPSVVQTSSGSTGASSGSQTATPTGGTQTLTLTSSNTAGTTTQTVTTTPSTTLGSSSQTQTTTPSNSLQTIQTSPTVTPTAAPVPTASSFSAPSTFTPSALNVLNEQTQLSYELVNLQLLLQGALDDDYAGTRGQLKDHVTLGFPISIQAPPQNKGDVAEVQVTVCGPSNVIDAARPTLQAILPREKTYNVARLVSSTTQLGAGAVISGVVNLGVSALWGHSSYNIVREQDTVAFIRRDSSAKCASTLAAIDAAKSQGVVVDPIVAEPITFGWQFRPLSGEDYVQPGLRQTFAQISFAKAVPGPEAKLDVTVRTCWRAYDAKKGSVGAIQPNGCSAAQTIPAMDVKYTTTAYYGIEAQDNGDGTITSAVRGSFPSGTKIRLGDSYVGDGSPGFDLTPQYLRFTAPAQSLAARSAVLVSPDGTEIAIDDNDRISDGADKPSPHPASMCFAPADGVVDIAPAGDGIVRLTLRAGKSEGGHFQDCLRSGDSVARPLPLLAILGGRAYGLSDAPFSKKDETQLTFLAPRSAAQVDSKIVLRRLFTSHPYEVSYPFDSGQALAVTGLQALDASSQASTFVLTGVNLKGRGTKRDGITFLQPKVKKPYLWVSDNSIGFSVPTSELKNIQQAVIVDYSTDTVPQLVGTPAVVAFPSSKLPKSGSSSDSGSAKSSLSLTLLTADASGSTFALSGKSVEGAAVIFPPVSPTTPAAPKGSYWFSLTKQQLESFKEVAVQLPAPKGKPAGSGGVVLVPLPPTDASSASALDSISAPSVAQGSTSPYVISGKNLQQVEAVLYLGKPLAFSRSADNTSLRIAKLPADLVSTPGVAGGVAIQLTNGAVRQLNVPVTASNK